MNILRTIKDLRLFCQDLHLINNISLEDDQPITGIQQDSRRVQKNNIFLALQGQNNHGISFLAQAITRGACCVIVDTHVKRDTYDSVAVPIFLCPQLNNKYFAGQLCSFIYNDPTRHMQLFGITGTSGKTTTSYFLYEIIRQHDERAGIIGTVGNKAGTQQYPQPMTTPQPSDLQSIFHSMLTQGTQSIVMEVSSHALEQGRASGSVFSSVGFTNLSHDHLDYHHTMEEYFQHKSSLFLDTRYGNPKVTLCLSDKWGIQLLHQIQNAFPNKHLTVVTHASDSAVVGNCSCWKILDITQKLQNQQATIIDPDGQKHHLELQIPGEFNVWNALLGVAQATSCGVDKELALRVCQKVTVPGRLQPVRSGQEFSVIVDYAHKPEALHKVLSTLRRECTKRNSKLITVIGAGGNRDTTKRKPMGLIAAQFSDIVIITDDNPRHEDPALIRQEIYQGTLQARGGKQETRVIDEGNRAHAIKLAFSLAQPQDIVLIAGKGHEQGQEIAGIVHRFNDYEVAKTILRESLE